MTRGWIKPKCNSMHLVHNVDNEPVGITSSGYKVKFTVGNIFNIYLAKTVPSQFFNCYTLISERNPVREPLQLLKNFQLSGCPSCFPTNKLRALTVLKDK